jgi:hypothetical protein
MDDASFQDTIVVDVGDDGWTLPTTPRSPTEDLTVQIYGDDGAWHRKAIGGRDTACGIPVNLRLRQNHRSETYEGALCRNCFTIFELAISERINDEIKKGEE